MTFYYKNEESDPDLNRDPSYLDPDPQHSYSNISSPPPSPARVKYPQNWGNTKLDDISMKELLGIITFISDRGGRGNGE